MEKLERLWTLCDLQAGDRSARTDVKPVWGCWLPTSPAVSPVAHGGKQQNTLPGRQGVLGSQPRVAGEESAAWLGSTISTPRLPAAQRWSAVSLVHRSSVGQRAVRSPYDRVNGGRCASDQWQEPTTSTSVTPACGRYSPNPASPSLASKPL